MAALPVDLLHLLSEQLAARLDFPTLYNCVVSSKHFANCGAVAALYRISDESPIAGGGSEALPLAEQDLNVQKWSIFWRTVTLSAADKTLYPYCRYLRVLNLKDLANLLEDDKFRGKISKYFFADNLARYHFQTENIVRGRAPRLDMKRIVAAIGDDIIQKAPLLEELTEPAISNVLSNALLTWVPRLQHLRRLSFWDGKALADETIRNLLHAHCPNLTHLTFYSSYDSESDHFLAAFIGGLQQNTLRHFENLSSCGIGPETCLALNSHGKSLAELKLALAEEGILALGLLQNCTAVHTLSLTSLRPSVDLKATQNDIYLEIVEWLKNCTSLKEMTFSNIVSAPDLITPALAQNTLSLSDLEISAKDDAMYVLKDHHDFHRALMEQTSLRNLRLSADAEAATRDDLDILLSTICSLKDLQRLKLTRVADYFTDHHIIFLAKQLRDLEELYIGGYGIADAILPAMANLKNLKTVTFSGITTFTAKGLKNYIDRLGPSNHGIVFSVDNADPDERLSPDEQESIREHIQSKVYGRFEYQLLRDPDVPEFNGDDDSD